MSDPKLGPSTVAVGAAAIEDAGRDQRLANPGISAADPREYKFEAGPGLPSLEPDLTQAVGSHRFRLPFAAVAAAFMLLLVGAGVLIWAEFPDGRIETASADRMAFPLPEKPSIAVLPFAKLGNSTAEELMSAGLAESLVNVLARNPLLFVIAHSLDRGICGPAGCDAASGGRTRCPIHRRGKRQEHRRARTRDGATGGCSGRQHIVVRTL